VVANLEERLSKGLDKISKDKNDIDFAVIIYNKSSSWMLLFWKKSGHMSNVVQRP